MSTPAATPAGAPAAEATPPAKPQPGTPEYDAAMIARADAASGQQPAADTPPADQRPAWLPEKFKSPEDLAKAYKELETKQGAAKPPVAPPAVVDPAATQQQVKDAGLDWDALNSEFAEKGALSPETYTALAAKGFPKEAVDTYIEGQQAKAAVYRSKADEAAGSPEAMNSMLEWAATNLTPGQIKVFNEATASGDVERMTFAIKGLRAQYEAAEGSKPNLLTGGNAATTGVEGFASMKELSAAQRDPKYKTDPAYRAKIEARVRATTAF